MIFLFTFKKDSSQQEVEAFAEHLAETEERFEHVFVSECKPKNFQIVCVCDVEEIEGDAVKYFTDKYQDSVRSFFDGKWWMMDAIVPKTTFK